MIKGATSYKETKFGIIPRHKLIKLEILGTKKGHEFIHNLVKKDTSVPITPDLIKKLHKISFGWIFPEWGGQFRKIQVTLSGKEAPEYFKIHELITNLCEDLRVRLKHLPKSSEKDYIDKVVELLSWFQHRFVFIHPFNDYNGRTARILTILILLRLNLPPIEIMAETGSDRKKYITAMQKADGGNYSLLEGLIAQSLTEALEKYQKLQDKGFGKR